MGRVNKDWSNISADEQRKMIQLQEHWNNEMKSLNNKHDKFIVKETPMTIENYELPFFDKKAKKILTLMI